jgi:hypothetical protein
LETTIWIASQLERFVQTTTKHQSFLVPSTYIYLTLKISANKRHYSFI